MKTDAIELVIEHHSGPGVQSLARAELAALKGRMTRLEAALQDICRPTGDPTDMKTWCDEDAVLLDVPGEQVIQELCEEIGRVRDIAARAAPADTPSNTVLVEREKHG